MTRHFPPPLQADAGATLLIDAVRCRQIAQDAGQPVLPFLSRVMALRDCPLLAPALDSLIALYEVALERPMTVGGALALSEDELLLIGLVDGSRPRDCLGFVPGMADAFHCAICSTRLLLAPGATV